MHAILLFDFASISWCLEYREQSVADDMVKVQAHDAFPLSANHVVLLIVVVSSLIAVSESWPWCGECDENQVCCNGECIVGSSCLGHHCEFNEECSSGEKCCNFSCTKESFSLGCGCDSDRNCSIGESCCSFKCINGSSRLGCYCDKHWPCSVGESCCSNVCVNKSNCLGQHCKYEGLRCSSEETCCNGTCVSGRLGCSCAHSRYCSSDEICCGNVCVNRSSCEQCCNNSCINISSCLGYYCRFDLECSKNEICCNDVCINGSSHLGCSCLGCLDCSRGESCCGNVCVNRSSCIGLYCKSFYDCCDGLSCCNNECVKRPNCLGQSCRNDSDCDITAACCDNKCKVGILGGCKASHCTTDSDCEFNNKEYTYCCDGTCGSQRFCVSFATLLGSLFVGILALVCFLIFIFCWLRKRRQRRALERPAEGTATTAQDNQHYQPMLNQEDHLNYPPPQYEEHQTLFAASKYPEKLRANEPPPPYNAEPQGESGGVYTTQTSQRA